MGIEMKIEPRTISIDGHPIFRYLPFMKKRAVGPFVFLDYLPPSEGPAEGLNVRPHPHIGLSTLSYLFKGQAYHRDSLGNELVLKPGDVNWMTAGRGIVHSERTPDGQAPTERAQHMLQFWVALPKDKEDMAPEFFHHAKSAIPTWTEGDVEVTLIAGEARGRRSPVQVHSKLVFMNLRSAKGGHFEFDSGDQALGLIVLEGRVRVTANQKQETPGHELIIFEPGAQIRLDLEAGAHAVLFGGQPFPEERFIEWNFVSSSKEKIQKAKQDWKDRKFAPVPHETEFIPLPE